MNPKENLDDARQYLADRINKGLEKPTLGERIKIGLIEGVVGGAVATGVMQVTGTIINKFAGAPWLHGITGRTILRDFGIGAAITGAIGAVFSANTVKRNLSMAHIQLAQDNVTKLENEAAIKASVIQTAGAEHALLDPQAATRQL